MSGKKAAWFWVKVVLSLVIGFLIIFPIYLYGRHFLIR